MWDLIVSDPVAWGSLLGIAIMCVMAGYYVYYFIHHVHEDEKQK